MFCLQVRHKSNNKVYAMKLLSKFEMVCFSLNYTKRLIIIYIIKIYYITPHL